MAIETTRALVLRLYPYRESSAILHLFTESRGRVHVIVRGLINKKTGEQAVDRGQIIETVLYTKGASELETATKIVILKTFPDTARDMEKTALRDTALELAHAAIKENNSHPELFPFFQKFLEWLEGAAVKDANPFGLWLFCTRFSQELGFEINMQACGRCGKAADEYRLNIPEGILECLLCRTAFDQTAAAKFPALVTNYLRHAKPVPAVLRAELGERALSDITDALADYCRYHFEIAGELRALGFLKSIAE